MKKFHRIKAPCPKCSYTLGNAKFIENPCPACKQNGYSMYDILNQVPGQAPRNKA